MHVRPRDRRFPLKDWHRFIFYSDPGVPREFDDTDLDQIIDHSIDGNPLVIPAEMQ